MRIEGKVIKYGDNINTDEIIPARFLNTSDPKELAKHCMEGIDKNFLEKLKWAKILVAGKNFGCGSSREHAPIALKEAGVACIIASSFARIFFRNAINQGLPVLLCDTDKISDGDELEINLTDGAIANLTSGITLSCGKMPPIMSAILKEGGLIPYIQKHKDFAITRSP